MCWEAPSNWNVQMMLTRGWEACRKKPTVCLMPLQQCSQWPAFIRIRWQRVIVSVALLTARIAYRWKQELTNGQLSVMQLWKWINWNRGRIVCVASQNVRTEALQLFLHDQWTLHCYWVGESSLCSEIIEYVAESIMCCSYNIVVFSTKRL